MARPPWSQTGLHVIAKPIGPICNLRCAYCFYLQKENLYPKGEPWRMSDETLEAYVRQYLEAQPEGVQEIDFAFQGGEPTLVGLDFFRRVVELQRKHCPPGMQVHNSLQTNGVLLDDRWCEFLKEHDFLVGLSIDGPVNHHNKYRLDKQGRGTFDQVTRAMRRLFRHGVEFNALCCVNRTNGEHPVRVYRFFRDSGIEFLQFIPIVERLDAPRAATPDGAGAGGGARRRSPDLAENECGVGRPAHSAAGPAHSAAGPAHSAAGPAHSAAGPAHSAAGPAHSAAGPAHSAADADPEKLVSDRSVRPAQFGRFLIGVFEEWVRSDVGRIFVRDFDQAVASWTGVGASLCIYARECGRATAIEHNGDLYPCDHFVDADRKLGNIHQTPIKELANSPGQEQFGRDKWEKLPGQCRECDVLFACHGACPKDRFLRTPEGEPGLNYLCEGYKMFFTHVAPCMEFMAEEVRAGRPAGGIMRELRAQRERAREAAATGGRALRRNDPCPCGSGRKYKHCCMRGC